MARSDTVLPDQMRLSQIIRAMPGLMGPRLLAMAMTVIPIGVAIGGTEAAMGLAFFNFLVHYGLVSGVPQGGGWFLPQYPIIALASAAALVTVLRLAGSLLPTLSTELFNRGIRDRISRRILGGVEERSVLSVAEVSHLLGNLAPRTAGLVNSLAVCVVNGLILTSVIAMLLLLSWQLTLVTVAIGAVAALPMVAMRRLHHQSHRFIADATSRFTERLLKDIRNIHFLKVSGANEVEQRALLGLAGDISYHFVRWQFQFAIKVNLPAFLGILVGIGLVWSNATYGFAEVSVLVPMIYLLSRLSGAVSNLLSALGGVEYGRPYAGELLNRFGAELGQVVVPPEDVDVAGHAAAAGAVESLSVRDLDVGRVDPLIEGLSFDLLRGGTLLISGASGRGKSTLLMTLVGIIPRLGGSVLWNGCDVDGINRESLRRRIGYAGADPYLLDGTIKANLLFGLDSDKLEDAEWRRALDLACCEFIDELPDGLETQLLENGEGLSAGQRQRLALARALLRRPEVLLLDEATANIDERTEASIMGKIREVYPDLIIIAVSHRSSMGRFATARVVLDEEET